MRTGKLDRRITFQKLTTTVDSTGGVVETWADLDHAPVVWAALEPMSARERFEADQLQLQEVLRFKIRYRSDLDERMRVVFEGRNWNIRHIREAVFEGRRRALLLDVAAL